eukprot:PITA_26112
MTFRRYFFEEFTDNVDGEVFFADKSKLKPSGLGTIRLKLPGLPDFLLHHVLYLPQLRRNLLSLVHIRQQGHSIHMFDGKVEVRKASDYSLVMTGIEEERLLKLQGTSTRAQNFSYNSHYDEADNVVERQLDCLDRFTNVKSFQEFDNHIPHLEEGIPILYQLVESSSEALSPSHETPTTDDTLSDVIDRIGRLNLESVPIQSTEHPGPSQKDFEPTSFKEVISHDEWKEAMQKEYDALIKNGTWKLVDPPLGTKPIGCNWLYKNKYKADSSLDKHKARLVTKGFAQKEGVDYEETFSPTTQWATIQTLFSLAA